jgi:hypothetical protein
LKNVEREAPMCAEENVEMVKIDIEIEDSLLFELMKRAHEADVTLNKYMEVLLTDYMDELERQDAEKQYDEPSS